MLWNAFSSFFQLSAAFCLTYTVIETFTANFNKKIYEVDNYFLTDVLNDFEKDQTENYRWLLKKKFSSLGVSQANFDPLASEVKSIIDRHKSMFFHSFIACLFFLIFAAFESFYDNHSAIDQKFCGLIIIPFASLYFYLMLMQPVKKVEIIKAELGDWKITIEPKLESYLLSLLIHSVSLIFGIILILLIPSESVSFFSSNICKLIVVFCMISIFIPFVTQYFQIKKTVLRYESVASEIRKIKNPTDPESEMQNIKAQIRNITKK